MGRKDCMSRREGATLSDNSCLFDQGNFFVRASRPLNCAKFEQKILKKYNFVC